MAAKPDLFEQKSSDPAFIFISRTIPAMDILIRGDAQNFLEMAAANSGQHELIVNGTFNKYSNAHLFFDRLFGVPLPVHDVRPTVQ